MGKLTAADASQ